MKHHMYVLESDGVIVARLDCMSGKFNKIWGRAYLQVEAPGDWPCIDVVFQEKTCLILG